MKLFWTVLIFGSCVFFNHSAVALNCPDEVGTAFTAQNGKQFCVSNIEMKNWFTAFSWCRAIGGHLATQTEACNGKISNCSNIKGSGRSGNAWLATPYAHDMALPVELSSGTITGNTGYYYRNKSYLALCTE